METAKRNMMEQLRQKYLWKYGFSDMAKLEEERGQIGGGESGGSPEIICEEIFYQNGLNLVSTHGRFQWYPILPAQNFYGCQNDLQSWNPTFLGIHSPAWLFKSGGDPV